MNIDERCYGYEPAQSQLNKLRWEIKIKNEELKEQDDLIKELREDIRILEKRVDDLRE